MASARERARRHGADIVPHLVNEEAEGDGARSVLPRHGISVTARANSRPWNSRGGPVSSSSPVDRSTRGRGGGGPGIRYTRFRASREDVGEIKMANGRSRRMSISGSATDTLRLAPPFRLRSRPMNYLYLPAFCATNSKNGMTRIAA